MTKLSLLTLLRHFLNRRGYENSANKVGGTTYEVTTHFDTDGKETVLEQFEAFLTEHKMILDTIRELADFVACYENVFTYFVAKKKGENDTQRIKMLQALIESSRKRKRVSGIAEKDGGFENASCGTPRVYRDTGIISDRCKQAH